MPKRLPLLGCLTLAGALSLQAQTIATPVYHSPYRAFKHSELSGYLSDPGQGVSVALQGEYRIARPKFDVGVTVGVIDAEGSADNLFGIGIDARLPVAKHTQDFPLDAPLTGALGALFANGTSGFLIPVGATFGRQFLMEDSNISFTPYVNPVIAPTFGDLLSDVQFGFGLGVDVALSKTVEVRVSGSLGDIEGVGIGLAWHR